MATLHLTASGANDTSSIQAAIDAAAAGDTIDFATGDYHVDGVTLNSVDHIILSNSSFRNNGLTFDFVKNSQIIDDQFSNIHGVGTGIHGYHMDNSTIAGDIFTNDYQGIGLVFGGVANQGRNVVVANNVGTGMSRMGIEIIGSHPVYPGETTNLPVKGNYFTNLGTPSPHRATTAYP